ncbi:PREDICTED: uncharacterized protein LOC107356488 [Acropora digitifera]|uniref:uncharacterized protein LOC107356488 n=1 Tax=Acropora digitifera TaxID=70779 RepID=UPI00077A659E|nr:PREDICTED: uncharacterized protein LOC107356488 [Acropora digitifera]
MSNAETHYAQIEKELLAIVFACERFESYVYGRDVIRVESNLKPLEAIFSKPLHSAPKRLQRMLLRLQKYNLQVVYKKGTQMFLPEINACDFNKELEEVDHQAFLPVSANRWQQIKHASADDPVLQQLRTTIREGWPETYARSLWQLCTALGMEGCIRRARDTLYWPRIAAELREYIAKCDICLSHRTEQSKEPLLQHEVIARHWAKVAADLCELDNRSLLVITDYYSNFIEVARLNSVTFRSVIKEMKAVFARYGIPDVLVTDNGPQFAAAEFAVFEKSWMFQHITSSPHYSQSNGKAENAVKTVKRLFTKCKESSQSEFLALLDW